ncbi:MAG: hypothetical protein ABSH09_00120 [Bryobacteraceae bacterium]|jgi:hypothetical protein
MPRLRIRPETWDLTYEIAISPSGFRLLDTPGKLCDVLLERLAAYGAASENFRLEDGDPGERALIIELDNSSVTVKVRGDRTEIHFNDCTLNEPPAKDFPLQIWQALEAALAGVQATSHTIQVEMEAKIEDGSYQEFLNRFAPKPDGLPLGTETAVVFYLPPDPKSGGKESSLVLNRTGDNDVPLQVSATLVYRKLDPVNAIEAAWDRLGGLLGALGIGMIEAQS